MTQRHPPRLSMPTRSRPPPPRGGSSAYKPPPVFRKPCGFCNGLRNGARRIFGLGMKP
jgi:hypothetical protein